MEVSGEHDQRDVNHRQVAGEASRQIDIGDRATLGSGALSDLRQRAAESIRGEYHALAGDHRCRDPGTAIGLLVIPAHSTYTMHDSIESQASV